MSYVCGYMLVATIGCIPGTIIGYIPPDTIGCMPPTIIGYMPFAAIGCIPTGAIGYMPLYEADIICCCPSTDDADIIKKDGRHLGYPFWLKTILCWRIGGKNDD